MNDADISAASAAVSALAGIVTAVAAGYAAWVWREHLHGASAHDLAKRVSVALRQVSIRHGLTLKNIEWLFELEMKEDDDGTALREFAVHETESSADALDAAVVEFGALDGQIEGLWGKDVFGVFDVIREECAMLSTFAHIVVRPDIRDTPAAQVVVNGSKLTPTFVGGTWTKAIGHYTTLAENWLAGHIGRPGAKPMSLADFNGKLDNVKSEVEALAKPEKDRLAKLAERVLEAKPAASKPEQ